ncbi:MAG: Rho termination factor N-terminal domain-containing protein [Acidiferrobacterales bacterium]|nr:Rho termination factor N-terminal domain-containing protein [Acidiferrobacterales bacterium]
MNTKTVKELKEIAKGLGIAGYSKLLKEELLKAISAATKKAAKSNKKAASKKASKETTTPAKTAKKKTAKKAAKKKTVKKAGATSSKQVSTSKPEAEIVARGVAEQNEEERIESAKFVTTAPGTEALRGQYPPDLGEDIENLPSLPEPRLTFLQQKPGVLLARWHLAPGHSQQAALMLRIGVLADQQFYIKQEVSVNSDDGSHYFHVDPGWPAGSVYLQLGHFNASGEFVVAIRRGTVRLPRLFAHSSLGVNWALGTADFQQEVQQSGPLGRVPQPGVLGGPSSADLARAGALSSSGMPRKG